jgi:hypothetical protein
MVTQANQAKIVTFQLIFDRSLGPVAFKVWIAFACGISPEVVTRRRNLNFTANPIARIELLRTLSNLETNEVNITFYKSPALVQLISSLISKPREADQEELVRFNLVCAERKGKNNV